MDERTRLGLGVLGAALFLKLLGDGLLRPTPWRINLFLWVAALVGAAAAVAWHGRLRVAGEGRWLVPVALVFAGGLAWRDSAMIVFLNLLAFLVAVSLAALWGRSGRLRLAGVSEYVLGGIYTGTLCSAGPVPVAAREIGWRQVARGRWRSPALAATRGVFFAAPLLLVFGALFVAADAVFEELVADLFGFDVAEVFGHLSLILVFAWITAGLLWVALLARTRENLALRRPDLLSRHRRAWHRPRPALPRLRGRPGALPFRRCREGRHHCAPDLRRVRQAQFFELVTVTTLALPILLLAHWLLRAEGRGGRRVFRVLAGNLIALLFVVMASALQRMYLYTQEYGLTELRFYATIFMAWLAVVLIWFLLTVLRGRRDRFAFSALLSGFAAVLLINAMNPDALIARTNLQRLEEGKRFDAYYLTTLSAAPAPVLFDALPEISGNRIVPEADLTVEEVILDRYRQDDEGDWRTWNLSRSRAGFLAETYADPGQMPAEARAERGLDVNFM